VNVPASQLPLVETNLYPLVATPVPGLPKPGGEDININLDVGFVALSNGVQFSVNGFPYASPTVPVLLQILSGAMNASEILPAVGRAGNSSYNFVDPVVRDVVSTGNTGDNVTIRFFTDNHGPWLFRCHTDWHLAHGFVVIFADDVPDTPAALNVTAAWQSLCPVYNKWANITS